MCTVNFSTNHIVTFSFPVCPPAVLGPGGGRQQGWGSEGTGEITLPMVHAVCY